MSAHTLLVVEDHQDHAEALELMLREDGHEVVLAASGEAALARLPTLPHLALVLLDLTLPGLSGEEFLRLLRAQQPALPVVVMTGLVGKPVPGAQAVLAKPLDYDRLRTQIGELLAARR
jgi:CheY-like chemotaxis protein